MKAITIRLDNEPIQKDFQTIQDAIKENTGMEPSGSEIIKGLIRDRAKELKEVPA